MNLQTPASLSDIRHAQRVEAEMKVRRQVQEIRAFYLNLTMYLIIIPIVWVICLKTTSSKAGLWAIWPTLGWGMGVTIHGLSVFAGRSFFGAEWEERKVEELMARENLKVVSREKQLVQAQMRLLQAQIEPHFLFNTLGNIQSLITRSPDRANLMMDNFIAYLRETLSASRAQEGTLSQEFALLRHYLELIKIRMDKRLRFTLDLAPELASYRLAPMLLQPIVENAIKHGLEPKIEGGTVAVVAAVDGVQVVIRVTDDGLGFAEQADSKGTGVGLSNLRERLLALYGGRAEVAIAEARPGTAVTLRLPR